MTKATRKAMTAVQAKYSFKGDDLTGGRKLLNPRWAKRITARAQRRLSRALVRDAE